MRRNPRETVFTNEQNVSPINHTGRYTVEQERSIEFENANSSMRATLLDARESQQSSIQGDRQVKRKKDSSMKISMKIKS